MFVDMMLPEQRKHTHYDPHRLLRGLCWSTSFFTTKSLNNVLECFYKQTVTGLPDAAHRASAALRSIPVVLQ
jgi:hypothetical protein